jgi:hypothetical protein
MAGLADAAFGERARVQSSLALRGHEKDFRLRVPVRSTGAWMAGSLDIGEPEAARFQAAMAGLVEDGVQAKIFKRYELV